MTRLKVKYKNKGLGLTISQIENSKYYQIQIKFRFGKVEHVIFLWNKHHKGD